MAMPKISDILKDIKGLDQDILVDGTNTDIEFIPTGSINVDSLYGGVAILGRISQLVSMESGGKTTLALQTIVQALHRYPDKKVLFIDAEHALDLNYLDAISQRFTRKPYPRDRVVILKPNTGEQAETAMKALLDKLPNQWSLIVIDSVATLLPEEMITQVSDGQKAQHATFWNKYIQTIKDYASNQNIAVLLINQFRHKLIGMNPMDKYRIGSNSGIAVGDNKYNNDKHATGGNAIRYALSISFVTDFSKTIQQDVEDITGTLIKKKVANVFSLRCIKSKVAPPNRQIKFAISLDPNIAGIIDIYDAVDILLKTGYIERTGSFFSIPGHKNKINGKNNLYKLLNQDSKLRNSVLKKYAEVLKGDN